VKELLNEWRNFLSEAEAKYSGILKVSLAPEIIEKVQELQDQVVNKNRDAVKLPEKALHVTAVHQSFMKPFRKQLKTLDLPDAPDPIISNDVEIETKEDGGKKSWAIKIENQEEMRNYVKQVMELLGSDNLDPEPERVFHISLANLTGNPHDSVR
jgi:hypothetical protein